LAVPRAPRNRRVCFLSRRATRPGKEYAHMFMQRRGRRRYYDIFSHVYDSFIKIHAHGYQESTREFLVNKLDLQHISRPYILEVCCGTGSVVFAFARRYGNGLHVGCDFSHGMLFRARQKDPDRHVRFIEGDAATLPFADNCFDAVVCSHALYELKGQSRKSALMDMRRVVRPDGAVLIMEHEVPRKPFLRLLFNIRMATMGSRDGHEFAGAGTKPFEEVFSSVALSHTKSKKSRLIVCRK